MLKSMKEHLLAIVSAIEDLLELEGEILEGKKDELFKNEDLEKLLEQEGILKAKILQLEASGKESSNLDALKQELRKIQMWIAELNEDFLKDEVLK